MYLILYFAFGLVPMAISQSSTCPDVKPVKDFNLTAYAERKWYEIARYNDDFEGSEDCTVVTFKQEKGGLMFNARSTTNNNIRNFGGPIDVKDNQNGVMFYHSKAFGNNGDTIPAITLAVDYDSYAVTYFCTYDEEKKKKTDMAWILSTTKTMTPATKTAIEDIFHSSNILDRNKFMWEKFTNAACKEDV